MSTSPLTIVMCEFGHPNYLAHGLDGIVRNCPTRPRVIVPFSDPTAFGWNPTRDFFIGKASGEKELKLTSIYGYIERCGDWARENNIEFHDLTALCLQRKKEIEARGIKYKGGHDCAIKNNWAAKLVTSEILCPNYDADFYPSSGYDVALIELAKKHSQSKSTWIATHVQPRIVDNPELYIDAEDVETTRDWHCTHLAWPVRSDIVTPQQWHDFYPLIRRSETIVEPCSARHRTHWNPQALRTEDFLAMGGFTERLGMDPDFDDRLGAAGFTRYSTYEAFTLHKAWMRGDLLAEQFKAGEAQA